MEDVKNRTDLEKLFASFYELALNDDLIGHFFTEVIPLDIEAHLPHIVDFWEANLWGKKGYKKNVLKVHSDIDQKSKMKIEHFDKWLELLNQSVDQNFKGPISEKLKTNALSIATVMKSKIIWVS